MRKLIKSLRPFGWSIFLIFFLLLGEAIADLTLPDYMSRIINVGIQQNGIENVAPVAIRSGKMSRLFIFMSETDQASVNSNYTILDKELLSPAEYKKYVDSYPALSNSTIFKLITTDKGEIEKLNAIFGKPMLIVSYIESGAAARFLGPGQTLPPGIDPFAVLEKLPAEQIDALRRNAETQIEALPSGVITQSAISYLSGEYRAIGIDLGSKQNAYMVRVGGIMLLLTLLSAAASVAVGFLAARVAAGFGRTSRRDIFTRVENYSNKEFDKFSTASLITRSTNDIQQIQLLLVILLRIAFYAPIMGVGGIIKALSQDVSMSWIIAAAVMALLLLLGVIFVIAIPRFRAIQKQVDRLNLITREMLTGLMVVRAFNTERFEQNRFERANVDLTGTSLFINRIMVFMMPAMMLLMNAVVLLIVWVGAHRIDSGSMQVGNMMAFMQYSIMIIFAFFMVSFVFVMMPRATVSAQRIAEVLETRPSINDPETPVKFSGPVKGLVEFLDVGFKYPDAEDYVLKNISFSAQPGKTTAIIGGTGSGKSTLINLVPRFYDVTEGKILVDKIDIRDVTQHDLREKIGYVPQRASLFSGTIASNIAYGKEEYDEAELKEAAEIAQLTDFVTGAEKGFDTPISQEGKNVSGGQKQRLAIARAVFKKPEIYIFDDSFSAIDFKTDAALRTALKRETGNAAVLIVAQRINTVLDADQIVVLDKGRMVGRGKHKELMKSCQVYQELALSQLTREELLS